MTDLYGNYCSRCSILSSCCRKCSSASDCSEASAHCIRSLTCDHRPAVRHGRHCPHSLAGSGLFRESEECLPNHTLTVKLINMQQHKDQKRWEHRRSFLTGWRPESVGILSELTACHEHQRAETWNLHHREQSTSCRPSSVSQLIQLIPVVVVNTEENQAESKWRQWLKGINSSFQVSTSWF